MCAECGSIAVKRSAMQKYCVPCSDSRSIKRRTKWAKEVGYRSRKTKLTTRGIQISSACRADMTEPPQPPKLLWWRSTSLPFSWRASKNHIFSNSIDTGGHIAKRKARIAYMEEVIVKIKECLADVTVVKNKVWLDFIIQKPMQNGDAVNIVDTLCDAIKQAIGVDDRWFSIRSLDWQIVKHNPMLFIGIGQESSTIVQACSSCGGILSYDKFQNNKGMPNGISRNCLVCCRDEDGLRRKAGRKTKMRISADLFG